MAIAGASEIVWQGCLEKSRETLKRRAEGIDARIVRRRAAQRRTWMFID